MNAASYPQSFEQLVPKTFIVETVLGCDLKCPECALGGDMISRKKGLLSFEQFKISADKIRPFCDYLFLHIWGEPLLNKDIFKIIEYASAFTRTNISTNGNYLTEETAEKLILSGVSDLIVSIDGVSQEIYEQYRRGGFAEKVLRSLKMLQELNLKHGKRVRINPQYIVFKHNQHEMYLFKKFCELLELEASFKAPYIRSDSRYDNSDDPQFVRPVCPDLASFRQAASGCPDPKQVFTILLDGSCIMCCYDHDGVTNYGNIYQQDVLEIWNSQKYRQDRWDIISGNAAAYCIDNCLKWTIDQPEKEENNDLAEDADSTDSISPSDTAVISKGLDPLDRSEDPSIEMGRFGPRPIPNNNVGDGQQLLELARLNFQEGKHNETFDTYEQLVSAYPNQAVEILAEVYDKYQLLPQQDRFSLYQSRYFNFSIKPTDKVLDIGSGNIPFQYATHLADIAVDDNTYGRAGVPFKYIEGKPVYECNLEDLDFADREFDFVYCSHVLEHVMNPEKACEELMRVAKRGFIETPTRGKDLWLNTTQMSNHHWAVESKKNKLIFAELTAEEIRGLQNGILLSMHVAPKTTREKAFSALIYLKANLINTMLLWEDAFEYEVHRLDKQSV
jgi:MoaA/NifB/PqqE/SkfB family radical SAM enzyme/ubiquinone/menaquinone biosynthesis C-methylase UbiE